MTFIAFGLNHETAPVKVREAFALSEDVQGRLYEMVELPSEAGVIFLSTCNRTEVYLYGHAENVEAVRQALCEAAGQEWPARAGFLYQDEDAVRHVLQVTCGLRSLVLGDAQILAQVKEAYRLAAAHDRVNTVLHRLMHTAFRAAKRVAGETALAQGAASVSSAAVAAAHAFFEGRYPDELAGRRALLVGTGQMGVLALQALRSYNLRRLTVTNRTPARAHEVADAFGADVVAWKDRYAAVCEADLVIVATGADEPVLRAEHMPLHPDEASSTLLIDIAVPRNVELAVHDLPGYTVFDLDLLNQRLVRVEEKRRSEVPAAEAIVEETLSEFVSWFFHQQALQPAIHAIRDTFDRIRQQEIERHQHRFSATDREELDRLTQSILQKLLAVPIVRLKSADPESIDFVRGIKILHALFSRSDCEDDSAQPPTPPAPAEANAPAGGDCPFEQEASSASTRELHQRLRARIQAFEALQQTGENTDE